MQDKQSIVRAELRREFFRRARWVADNQEEVWAHLSGKSDNDLESDVLAASRTATAGDLSGAVGELLTSASDFAGERQKATAGDGRDQERASAKSPGRLSTRLPNADDLISDAYRTEDIARADAIIMYAVSQTENSYWFQGFRSTFLNGIMPLGKSYEFLLSPATRLLPQSSFMEAGEELLTHTADLVDEQMVLDEERLRKRYSILFGATKKTVVVTYDEEKIRTLSGQPPPQITFDAYFADYVKATYYPGTVFDEVMQAAYRTSSCLLGCSHRAALAFLLTREPPRFSLIDAGWRYSTNAGGDLVPLSLHGTPLREAPSYSPSHISMTIPIWLSADVVEKAFRLLQQSALHGKENRQSNVRNLRLFKYVLSEKSRMGIADEGTEEQRRKIWKSWNEKCGKPDPLVQGHCPEWRISDFAQFTRICQRVEENLFPSFFYG